jgi:hypothetical protein
MLRGDFFLQDLSGDHGRDQRLDADDQRRYAGRQAVADRPEDAGEINAVNQRSGDGGVEGRRAVRPFGVCQNSDDRKERASDEKPRRQEQERLAPGHGVARADETRRPKQHKERRKQPFTHQKLRKMADCSRWTLWL